MLSNLKISNYALIKNLSFEPSESLNSITGETGSGKSILLGALGLLMGKRADTSVLLDAENKCVVEGHFSISKYNIKPLFEKLDIDYENETIIRREIVPSGKSRAFVNDTPVTLETLKELSENLMDIHSQHDNLLLSDSKYQQFVLDAYAKNESLLAEYKALYKIYSNKKNELNELLLKKNKNSEELDYKNLLLKELKSASLNAQEWEDLKNELSVAENAQEVKTSLQNIVQISQESDFSILSGLKTIEHELSKLSKISSEFTEYYNRLKSVSIEFSDITQEISRKNDAIDFDENRVQFLTFKSDLINGLFHKHKTDDIQDLIALQQKLEQEIFAVENIEELIKDAEKVAKESLNNLLVVGKKLSESRKTASKSLSNEISALLSELGMPQNTILVQLTETEPTSSGIDEVEILFSANKGISPQPLRKVASGGEFSRLLFSIKYILADKISMPSIVFDEIDTGISGEIARKMGSMMKKMGTFRQVITITHLPQVASLASTHFKVLKKETEELTKTEIFQLTEEKRIEEIAKMLSGANPSEAAFQNAKELLSLNAN